MNSTMNLLALLATAETHLSEAKRVLGEVEGEKILDNLEEKTEFLLDEYAKLDLSLRTKKMVLCKSLVAMGFLGGGSTRSIYISGTYFTFLSARLVNLSTKGWGVSEEDSKITTEEFFHLLEKWSGLHDFFKRMIESLNQSLDQNLGKRAKDLKRINEIVGQLVALTEVKK